MLNVNTQTNHLSLSDSQMQSLRSFYDALEQILKLRDGLNQRESSRLIRLRKDNLLFVHDSLDAINQLPELCPRFLDPEKVREEGKLFEQIRFLEQIHANTAAALKDLRMKLGDKCYRNGLMIYNSVQNAATNGYPKVRPIYKQMRSRFRMGSNGNPEIDPQNDENDPMINAEPMLPAVDESSPETSQNGGDANSGDPLNNQAA